MYRKTPEELAALGVQTLPRTLEEATAAFGADPLSETVFGEEMRATWIDYKNDEWRRYLNHVSDWEKKRYLKFF